jgi:hypothetical protein
VFNNLRIWFVPVPTFNEGLLRPFAEEPCPKDKRYSPSDIMAFTIPTMPDDQIHEMPRIIFGAGHGLQERYPDPEVQGGKIALIAFKQLRVQKPPNILDNMNSRYLKQVAYNDRIIEAEKEVSAINCEAAEFLAEMTLDPTEQVIICVNGSEEMKKGEEAIGGQLWMQGNRRMTAHNHVQEGLANTRESAILWAAVDAVTWTHALEIDGPRKGQRVVVYPKELSKLEQALETKDPSIDTEDGHAAAYIILQASRCFENPPVFLKEDHPTITSGPYMSQLVPGS